MESSQLTEKIARMDQRLKALELEVNEAKNKSQIECNQVSNFPPIELPRNLESLSNNTIDYYIDLLYQDAIGTLTTNSLLKCFSDDSALDTTKNSSIAVAKKEKKEPIRPKTKSIPKEKVISAPSSSRVLRKSTRPVATPASNKKRKLKKQVVKPNDKKINNKEEDEMCETENKKFKAVPDSSSDVPTEPAKPLQKRFSQIIKDKIFGSSDPQSQPANSNNNKIVEKDKNNNGQTNKWNISTNVLKKSDINVKGEAKVATTKLSTFKASTKLANVNGKENSVIHDRIIVSPLDDELAPVNHVNKTPEGLSFALRRNMWERRSLGPGFKFQR